MHRWLVIGRLLIGLGIGVSADAVPAYLSIAMRPCEP